MRLTGSIVHREILILVFLVAVATAAFVFTRAIAGDSRETRLHDASDWFRLGQSALAAGRLPDAIDSLRHAVALDRDNRGYQLTLANALADDGQDAGATQVLVGLRTAAPEDPDVNLQLARLAAHTDNLTDAVRYYQNALYGVWAGNESDQEARRRQIRVELIQLLLAHQQQQRALSELLVLSSNLPADAASQIQAGQLFLSAGDARRALDHFTRALALDKGNGAALAGAGEAAFELGDYAHARAYLRDAPDMGRVADLRAVTDLVLSNDPLTPRLPSAERRRRLSEDFTQASARLTACTPVDAPSPRADLAALRTEAQQFQASIDKGDLRRSPDAIDTGFYLSYRIERATQSGCAQPTPLDRAIVLIGRLHGFEQQ